MVPNILIVDDVPANLVALKALLRGLETEVNVVNANSGGEALEMVLEHEFALILTDVQMPEMDGFELASILQDHEEWNQIPIIFITAAYKDEQNRDRGYATGAVDYIQKPIEEHILLSKVTIFLKIYEQRQQIAQINADLERRVLARTAELAHTQSLAKIGGWRIDPKDWGETLSSQACRILSGEPDETVACPCGVTSLFDYLDPESRDYHRSQMDQIADDKGERYEFEVEIVNGRGNQCHLFCTTYFVYADGKLDHIEGAIQDITERQRAKDVIQYLEMHDPLTTLPNRNAFQENIVEAISDARRKNRQIAIMLLDIDNFKDINDIHGQSVGDFVLTEISRRLKDVARNNESLFRVGGDEFALVLPQIRDFSKVVRRAEKCIGAVNKKLSFFGEEFLSTAGIGIAVFPEDGSDVDSILKAADLALQRSKSEGGNSYNFYDEEMSRAFHRRKDQQQRLEDAIRNEEFELYFQPKIDLKTKMPKGAEALIRWNDPEFGLIPPDEFIPLAEETGLIEALGEWIVKDACYKAVAWKKEFGRAVPIAINVSVEQIKSPDFVPFLRNILKETGTSSDLIEIEITETSLLESVEVTSETLRNIKEMGIDIALDDFGTGYSSLTHLKSLLATSLKIDRSFIQNIMTDTSDAHIADMVISVAHKLNMQVVAEGIEHSEQCERLRLMKCDLGQGYYYSKPLKESDFIEWFKQKETN